MQGTVNQPQEQTTGPWWKNKNFVESEYVTGFTDWFTTFTAKAAHLVLIVTILYTSAELYPGVSMPSGLNLTVFILQMLALDMGGIGLSRMAKKAKKGGNCDGADNAANLSGWLIKIMIAGIISVSLEQIVGSIQWGKGSSIPAWIAGIKMLVELTLIVARAICAVKYGHVIEELRSDSDETQVTIGNLKATNNQQQVTINNLEVTTKRQQVTIDQQKVTIEKLQGDLVTMKGNHEADKVTLQETISSQKDTLVTMQSDLESKVTLIGDLTTNLAIERDEHNRLENEVTLLHEANSDLEATIARLEASMVTIPVTPMPEEVTTEVTMVTMPVTPVPQEVTTGDLEQTTEELPVTTVGNQGNLTKREQIEAIIIQAMNDNKKLSNAEIAQLANTTEAYVKKHGAAIRSKIASQDHPAGIITFPVAR